MKFFLLLSSFIVGAFASDPRNFDSAVKVIPATEGQSCTDPIEQNQKKSCVVKNFVTRPTIVVGQGGSCKNSDSDDSLLRLCELGTFCSNDDFCRPVRQVEEGESCTINDGFLFCASGKVCRDRICVKPVPESYQILLPTFAVLNALAILYISREYYKNMNLLVMPEETE